jgi:hypothetical protein
MDRRQYLAMAVGLGAGSLAGCNSYSADETDTAGADDGSPAEQSTDGPAGTRPPTDPNTLSAGSHTVTLADPRVRASIRDAGVHVDVRAEPGSQFLVVDAETGDTRVGEIPVRVVADGEPITDRPSLVGRPEEKTAGVLGFPVPVSDYGSVAVVLESAGETARWRVPDATVETLSRAPEFTVDGIELPDSVQSGESFDASFTVTNDGDRDARFLAEFGHTLLSDTGEVEVAVPAGDRRTHTSTIDPFYDEGPAEIPVVLDWGLQARHATVAVGRETATTDLPPRSDALSIESSYPIDGTMVNVGVGGTARNAGTTALTNCVVVASGDVGNRRFSATTHRDRLEPDESWDWEVAFGDEADAQGEPVGNIAIETRAASSD